MKLRLQVVLLSADLTSVIRSDTGLVFLIVDNQHVSHHAKSSSASVPLAKYMVTNLLFL